MPCLLELSCLEPVIRGTRCRIAVPATGDFADCEQDFADCERRLTHTESSGHDDVFMSVPLQNASKATLPLTVPCNCETPAKQYSSETSLPFLY